MKLFIDESGFTGTQRYDLKWNFEKQPYFMLCSILVEDERISLLEEKIKELFMKYKIP